MTTTLNHVRALRDLEKAVTLIENLREGIADVLRNGTDDSRDKAFAELANLAHELWQAQIAARPGR